MIKDKVLQRFLKYVKIDTQSDPESHTTPSTKKQWDLAKLLEKELRELGLKDISLDENAYLMATLPSNSAKKTPAIGFIAHIDTSPDMSGTHVNPQIIRDYDGGEIRLNKNFTLSPSDFPELSKYTGKTLITTDGTTLLGADDKAGIAEILTAIEYLVENPEIEHGDIRIGFTPDEEIGRGADHFDVAKFNAPFAYTLDGGEIGELEYENFNAALAKVTIQGRNVHPGTAKDKMINAIHVAMELNEMLPSHERPEYTQHYEGFYHLIDFKGSVEKTTVQFIIRDHDKNKFEQKKVLMEETVQFLNKKYKGNLIELTLTDQYFNMRKKIEPVMHIIELARKAYDEVAVKPIIKPIRGGTDGSRLSYMGLPTPNIFAGGHNFHGKFEYIPLESMVKATEVIIKIAEIHGRQSN